MAKIMELRKEIFRVGQSNAFRVKHQMLKQESTYLNPIFVESL